MFANLNKLKTMDNKQECHKRRKQLIRTSSRLLCFKYYGLSKVPIENGKNCKTLLYMKTRTGGYFESDVGNSFAILQAILL